jgi:hypothetical protein
MDANANTALRDDDSSKREVINKRAREAVAVILQRIQVQ